MITIQLRLGSIYGAVAADLTAHATACQWSYNLHGAASLSLTAPRMLVEAARIYTAVGLVFVVVLSKTNPIWVGRLAQPELWADTDGSGITLRAYGLWEALDDAPYTALWSDASVGGWKPDDQADTQNQRYQTDTNNRIYVALQKGENYQDFTGGAPKEYCLIRHFSPDMGVRQIVSVSFDYDINMFIGFVVELMAYNSGYASGASIWSATTTGSAQSGTENITLAAQDFLALRVYNDSGATATPTADTGDDRAILTNVRVKTTTAASVTADLIAAHIASVVNAVNPALIGATSLATNPNYDLTDLIFEDARPTVVLNEIVAKGDGAGTVYVAGVNNGGMVFLHPTGTNGRTWFVDVTDLSLASDRARLANSVYATYQDASRRTLRTAVAADAAAVTRYGYTRRRAVKADTTSATRAEEWRDTYLADSAAAKGQADIDIDRVYTASGGYGELSDVLPGDTITVNLPLVYAAGGEIDRARSFRIAETSYNPIARRLRVTPEEPLPRLDVLIAQGVL